MNKPWYVFCDRAWGTHFNTIFLHMIKQTNFSFRTTLFICLALAISMNISCTAYRAAMVSDEGVYYFSRVEIGGVKQSVKIRGADRNNPVMLYLHGGPGFPLFPIETRGGAMRELERHFTLVYWEQRGTGRSFSWRLPRKSMNVEQFVEDAREVAIYAMDLLDDEKVFVWGHSWGSNVGAILASRHPGIIHAYMSTGQSVNPFKNERLNYEFVLENALRTNNHLALRQLERVDTVAQNYGLRDALLLRKWVYHYGGIVKGELRERPYVDIGDVVNTLTAYEYSLFDKFNMLILPYFSAETLWDDLQTIDLKEMVPRIDVPVFFLVGMYDIIVSATLAQEYFEMLQAPAGKELILFEQSAHRPFSEEQEKFLDVVIDRIRPLALPPEPGPPQGKGHQPPL